MSAITAHKIVPSNKENLKPGKKMSRPQIDPLLEPGLDALDVPDELDVAYHRQIADSNENANAEVVLSKFPHLRHQEYMIEGLEGNNIVLSVFSPITPSHSHLPALYHIHGGGQIAGNRFTFLDAAMGYLDGIESVVVTVEYRLAPETRAPGAATDCHVGLVWLSKNARGLGIDPASIIVYGVSGGGGLAAVTGLMARDMGMPEIPVKGQLLLAPMLDDRCNKLSDMQFEIGTVWCGVTNRMAWEQILGADRGRDTITPYQAPAGASDLSGLPSTYIDASECEVFRDAIVQYATNLWRCGTTCELHVWPGGFHSFDLLGDQSLPITKFANDAKVSWIRRLLCK